MKVGQAVANTVDTPFETAYWKDSSTNKIYLVKVVDGILTVTENGSSSSDTPSEDISGLEDLLPDRLLIWHDEFDGDSLNENNWIYELGYKRNNEPQYYKKENLTVSDSICHIVARKEDVTDETSGTTYHWTSASIKTREHMNFRYGRIEAKLKVSGIGQEFPAFWLCGIGLPWVRSGEIDMMEMWDSDLTNATYNIHWADISGVHQQLGKTKYICSRDEWHIFACEVDSEYITLCLDGNELYKYNHKDTSVSYFAEDNGSDKLNPFFRQLKFAILNLALSYSETVKGDTDRTMDIDWIRLYASTDCTEKKEISDFHFYVGGWDENIKSDGQKTIQYSTMKLYNNKRYAAISPMIYDSNDNMINSYPFSFTVLSSNEEVAEVIENKGLLVKATGNTDITVTLNNGMSKTRRLVIS